MVTGTVLFVSGLMPEVKILEASNSTFLSYLVYFPIWITEDHPARVLCKDLNVRIPFVSKLRRALERCKSVVQVSPIIVRRGTQSAQLSAPVILRNVKQ
jgi:hypothetical protein